MEKQELPGQKRFKAGFKAYLHSVAPGTVDVNRPMYLMGSQDRNGVLRSHWSNFVPLRSQTETCLARKENILLPFLNVI